MSDINDVDAEETYEIEVFVSIGGVAEKITAIKKRPIKYLKNKIWRRFKEKRLEEGAEENEIPGVNQLFVFPDGKQCFRDMDVMDEDVDDVIDKGDTLYVSDKYREAAVSEEKLHVVDTDTDTKKLTPIEDREEEYIETDGFVSLEEIA